MEDKTHQARVIALSLAQCATAVTLLRAHGQDEHADSMEAAISMLVSIVSDQLGRDTVEQAMRWASNEVGSAAGPSGLVTSRH